MTPCDKRQLSQVHILNVFNTHYLSTNGKKGVKTEPIRSALSLANPCSDGISLSTMLDGSQRTTSIESIDKYNTCEKQWQGTDLGKQTLHCCSRRRDPWIIDRLPTTEPVCSQPLEQGEECNSSQHCCCFNNRRSREIRE